MKAALALLLALVARPILAADAPTLKDLDAQYLTRHEGTRLADSIVRLRALVLAQPQDYELLWRLGRAELAEASGRAAQADKLKGYAAAAATLNRAVAAKPSDAQGHYWLAREMAAENEIRRTLGLAKSMKAELETALTLDPNHAGAHQLYGELLSQLPGLFGGDKKRAVKECEEALRLTPNETGRYVALAEAYLAVKRNADAIATLRRALEIKTPDDPASHEQDLASARALLAKLTGER